MNHEELSERLWRFAARVSQVVDALPDTRLGRLVAGKSRPRRDETSGGTLN